MLDLTKPVQTRDGRRVRILCTDRKNLGFPVVGLITEKDGIRELTAEWTIKGTYWETHPSSSDLVNIPQRHVHADFIIAWANGATIEYKTKNETEWHECVCAPRWVEINAYRVKP